MKANPSIQTTITQLASQNTNLNTGSKARTRQRLPSEGQASKVSGVTGRTKLPTMILESKLPGNGIPVFITNNEEPQSSHTSLIKGDNGLVSRKQFSIQNKTRSAKAERDSVIASHMESSLRQVEKRIENQLLVMLEKEIVGLNQKLEEQRSLNKLIEADKVIARHDSTALEQVD